MLSVDIIREITTYTALSDSPLGRRGPRETIRKHGQLESKEHSGSRLIEMPRDIQLIGMFWQRIGI